MDNTIYDLSIFVIVTLNDLILLSVTGADLEFQVTAGVNKLKMK